MEQLREFLQRCADSHLSDVAQQVGRVLIHAIGAGAFELFAGIAA